MGPAATADFYQKLILATPATRDQDHLRVVMWADPTIPNRQEALLANGADPTPWLEEGVERIVRSGAEIVVVPCNTIHAYLPGVLEGKDIEFISIIDTTVEAVCHDGRTKRVGLLATDGALASDLYQSAFRKVGVEAVLPSDSAQKILMQLVYSVKEGGVGAEERARVRALLTELETRGVSTVVVGCTEISVLLEDLESDMRVIDPSQVLAHKTVERARCA